MHLNVGCCIKKSHFSDKKNQLPVTASCKNESFVRIFEEMSQQALCLWSPTWSMSHCYCSADADNEHVD